MTEPDADRDWVIILSVFFVLFIAVACWSAAAYYFLFQPSNDAGNSMVASYQIFNNKKVEDILNSYQKRQNDFQNLSATATPFVDPSL